MTNQTAMWNGIINIRKEKGYTSSDVVARMRGILHQRKIGHTGTLDPEAEGVLVVLLGNATKLSDLLTDHDKTYRCTLLLGTQTDTQDMTGTVLRTSDVSGLDPERVREAVLSFVGTYDQVPPMYSAKKVNGKKLYDLAREGKEVERKSVPVRIDDIRIEKIDLPEVTFSVDCSRGTYIRTLCHDIGTKLGCGGAMKSLLRTRVGDFYLDDALTLSRLEKLAEEQRVEEYVIAPEEMFLNCLRVRVTSMQAERKLKNGNRLSKDEMTIPAFGGGEMIRVCTQEGDFTGIYRYDENRGDYTPQYMF